MRTLLYSLVLSLTASVLLTAIAGWLIPDLYGSCFEGSCGYMQAFIVVPLVTLLLFTPVNRLTKRLGPLLILGFTFPFAWILGALIFEEVGGYGVPLVFSILSVLKYKDQKAMGRPLRDLFIKPDIAPPQTTK